MAERKLFSSDPIYGQKFESVDAENGVIKGVKIASEGDLRGHDLYLNKKFINDLVHAGRDHAPGVKARFGHPNMCSTTLGTYIGRYKNFRTMKEADENFEDIEMGKPHKTGTRHHAIADLHFDPTAKNLPKLGDVRGYLLDLAQTSPDMFGNSIVFEMGPVEMLEWEDEEKVKHQRNIASLKMLVASDLVDSPAATDGLFEQFDSDELALQVTNFLDDHPQIYDLAVEHPDVVETFLKKYTYYKSLKNKEMPNEESKIRTMFDDLKDWITEQFSVKAKEETGGQEAADEPQLEMNLAAIPDAVIERLDAFEAAIKNDTEVADLSAKVETLTAEIETLKGKLSTAEKNAIDLEGKLTKVNAKSTKVEGVEGMEDEGTLNLPPERKSLMEDLKSLRSQLSETHT
jgi:hypothetical protein